MKLRTAFRFVVAGLSITAVCQTQFPARGQAGLGRAEEDKAQCTSHLKEIHTAIQAYRHEHKEIPNWLSDLVPAYLSNTNALLCPVAKRTGQGVPYEHLADPKVFTSYLFEFCPAPTGSIWGGGSITMRDWKRRQMGLIGSDVPIVRCHWHSPTLNLSFGGKIYEAPLNWEENFSDVVNMADWSPRALFASPSSGGVESPGPSRPGSGFAEALANLLGGGRNPARPPAQVAPAAKAPSLEGKPAPDFTLPLLEGGEVKLSDHKGKDIVILDFWATWCGPCRRAMPILVEVAETYKDKGVVLYGVNLREDPDTINNYLKGAGLELAVPLDKDGRVRSLYEVRGIPQSVIIGKDGTVEKVHIGFSPTMKSRTIEELETLLSGRKLSQAGPSGSFGAEVLAKPSLAARIPQRDPNARPHEVNLDDHYNYALNETWHPSTSAAGSAGNDLAALPTGLQTFDGVRFDVRGLVQLQGLESEHFGARYPDAVRGIPIHRKARQLHFLHGVGWQTRDGDQVASYFVHYADGSAKEISVKYGRDVRDWWYWPDEPQGASAASVAWTGKNPATQAAGMSLRLYKMTWDNPVPGTEISSIDFLSAMAKPAPFLIALTAE